MIIYETIDKVTGRLTRIDFENDNTKIFQIKQHYVFSLSEKIEQLCGNAGITEYEYYKHLEQIKTKIVQTYINK